ncbi:MAG: hypothetical protein LAN63_03430 [Acidobacteriia bacterium]|nr:hypothetical protein [Terriglobia bacterium]
MNEKERSEKKEEKAHDAFIRWQQATLTHLGHTINLIFVLTTAAFGFAVNLAVNGKITPSSPGQCAFLWSAGLLATAMVAGLSASFSRLWDFRHTAQVARGREMQARADAGKGLSAKEQAQAQNLNCHREAAGCWGRFTWWLLCLQSLGFFFGVFLLAYAVRRACWQK